MISDDHKPLHANIVLAIGAHADDIDFMAAGTVSKLAAAGADVYYLVLTDGCKGTADRSMDGLELAKIRHREQQAAAKITGARDVLFLDCEDGALADRKELAADITRILRQLKPDTVIAMDPTMVYCAGRNLINHPDHRAGGQAALDAIYPLARDHLQCPELLDEGLQPHKVKTVLLTNFNQPDYCVDIAKFMDIKLRAVAAHASQMPDMKLVERKIRTYASIDGQHIGCSYAEAFVRIDVE